MHLWHDISVGENAPEEVNVIIESPKGAQNKYEIDKESGLIALDRVLYSAVMYPADYGFIPQTLWDDGDALDALVLVTNPTFPGCKLSARPIGLLKMIDSGESDDKLVCVPADDPRWNHVTDINDLSPHKVKEMVNFFETYKLLREKEVEITDVLGADAAKEALKKGVEMYNEKFSK